MVKIEQTGGRLTEEEILHGKNDAYGIYQINWKGEGREYAFLSFDSLRAKGKAPERKDYQLVYSDILETDENRDSLFIKFNLAHPSDFTGHSLSISDILVLKKNGEIHVSYFPDDDMYSGKCDLLAGGRICREMLDAVPRYKENREVRKAVKYLENHFNKKEELSLSKPKKQEQTPRL